MQSIGAAFHDRYMEISRRTWTAAIKLAAVLSVVAVVVAVAASIAHVPQAAVVLPVIVIAFAASWIQTERIRRRAIADMVLVAPRS